MDRLRFICDLSSNICHCHILLLPLDDLLGGFHPVFGWPSFPNLYVCFFSSSCCCCMYKYVQSMRKEGEKRHNLGPGRQHPHLNRLEKKNFAYNVMMHETLMPPSIGICMKHICKFFCDFSRISVSIIILFNSPIRVHV